MRKCKNCFLIVDCLCHNFKSVTLLRVYCRTLNIDYPPEGIISELQNCYPFKGMSDFKYIYPFKGNAKKIEIMT